MAYIYRLTTKIRLTMLFLSGFELYSRWVPLNQAMVAGAAGSLMGCFNVQCIYR